MTDRKSKKRLAARGGIISSKLAAEGVTSPSKKLIGAEMFKKLAEACAQNRALSFSRFAKQGSRAQKPRRDCRALRLQLAEALGATTNPVKFLWITGFRVPNGVSRQDLGTAHDSLASWTKISRLETAPWEVRSKATT